MWDLNDVNPPESEAVQAEREIVEDIVRNEVEAPIAYGPPNLHDQLHAAAQREAERDTAAYVARRDGEVADQVGEVRFKRLRNGAWGVTGPSRLLVTGQLVNVTKRDGSVTLVTVGKVVWSGDGKAIAATRRA